MSTKARSSGSSPGPGYNISLSILHLANRRPCSDKESIWIRTNIYCMYEILVTGPLCISECAGECRLSANLCKRVLDVTADIVEATCNADISTINASEDFQ